MRELIKKTMARALDGVNDLPPAERADIYDAVGTLVEPHLPEMALECIRIARAIREAEQLQLQFGLVMKQAIKGEGPAAPATSTIPTFPTL